MEVQNPNIANQQPQRKLEEGRWSKEEHARFIEGIKLYNKNWKKVEEHVQTRSGAQIRSHAQKFFNRLEKEMEKKQLTQQMAIEQENEKVLSMIIMKKKEKNEEKQRKKDSNVIKNVLSQQSLNSSNIDKDSKNINCKPINYAQEQQYFQPQQLYNHYNENINPNQQKNFFYNPLKNSLPQISPLGFSQYGLLQNIMLNCYSNWMRQCQQLGKYPHLFSSPHKFKGIESQVLEKYENYIQCQKKNQQQQNNKNTKGSFTVFNTNDNKQQYAKVSSFKRKFSNSFTQLDEYESNTNTSNNDPNHSSQQINKKIKVLNV